MQRSALCRSRRELSNAYFVAKFDLDTAENEPCQVCPIFRCASSGTPRRRASRPQTSSRVVLRKFQQIFSRMESYRALSCSLHEDQRMGSSCSSVYPTNYALSTLRWSPTRAQLLPARKTFGRSAGFPCRLTRR